ncbi:hypothetical protein KM799_08420 [Clostridium tyrobutyricum]|uniref:hypothetical protein n=1 Tax=Clostridium tyrobutyricum TaxID=1519 RepID=UPI001C38BC6C|nr:hypothetical protein [Clostridium tyrobutyricum]MBV4439261.1 hypothetical protein [Clostridium tyrobutyricum]MBV4446626.1 hypothetical protein [Clostridium tyrobutyricum]
MDAEQRIKQLEQRIAVLEEQVQAQPTELKKAFAFLFDRSEYKRLIKQGKTEWPKMLTEALEKYFNI